MRAIEIRWQQSDLSLLPADPRASSTASSVQSPTNTHGTTTTTTSGTTTSPSETTTLGKGSSGNGGNNNRLSHGAIAGICIGVLVVLIFATVGMILWLRYRKNHLGQTLNTEPQVPQLDGQPVSELGLTLAKGLETQNQGFHRQYSERHELDTESRPPVVVGLAGERYLNPTVELDMVTAVTGFASPQVAGKSAIDITPESTSTPALGSEEQRIFNECWKSRPVLRVC